MMLSRSKHRSKILSLEADAMTARSGFACVFSSSDEYERALITERRARGRYARSSWPVTAIAVVVAIAGTVAYWM
jgi:hypothetical protein